MASVDWVYWGFWLLFAFNGSVVARYLWSSPQPLLVPAPRLPRFWMATLLSFLVLGLYLRAGLVDEFLGGHLSPEEEFSSVLNIAELGGGRSPSAAGAAQWVSGYLIHGWLSLTGFSVPNLRWFFVLGGLFSLGFLYGFMRLIAGPAVGLAATALLSISPYAIYFSKICIQYGFPVPLLPLTAWLAAIWYRNSGRTGGAWASLTLGLTVGAGLFTYPGYLLSFGSLLLSWLLLFCANAWKAPGTWKRNLPRPAVLPEAGLALAGSLAILLLGFWFHFHLLKETHSPLVGGGNLVGSGAELKATLLAMSNDLFGHPASWYIPRWSTPFIDVGVLPFAALGGWLVLKTPGLSSWFKASVLFGPVMILFSLFLGHYPGARRVLAVLVPLHALAAVGVCHLLTQSHPRRWLKGLAGAGALAALLLVGYLDLTQLQDWSKHTRFSTLIEALWDEACPTLSCRAGMGAVIIHRSGLTDVQRNNVRAYHELARRYSPEDFDCRSTHGAEPSITFFEEAASVSPDGAAVRKRILEDLETGKVVLITPAPELATSLVAEGRVSLRSRVRAIANTDFRVFELENRSSLSAPVSISSSCSASQL